MLREWKLNPDAAEYKRNIDANLYKTFEKKKFNCHNSEKYWPTSITEKLVVYFYYHYITYCNYYEDKYWANSFIIKVIYHV